MTPFSILFYFEIRVPKILSTLTYMAFFSFLTQAQYTFCVHVWTFFHSWVLGFFVKSVEAPKKSQRQTIFQQEFIFCLGLKQKKTQQYPSLPNLIQLISRLAKSTWKFWISIIFVPKRTKLYSVVSALKADCQAIYSHFFQSFQKPEA